MSEKISRRELFKLWILEAGKGEPVSIRESIRNWRDWYMFYIGFFAFMIPTSLIILGIMQMLPTSATIGLIVFMVGVLIFEVYWLGFRDFARKYTLNEGLNNG